MRPPDGDEVLCAVVWLVLITLGRLESELIRALWTGVTLVAGGIS